MHAHIGLSVFCRHASEAFLLVWLRRQVVELPKYATYREPPPESVAIDPSLEPYWATRCLLECLPLGFGSHVFIGLAGWSLGLAMVGRGVLPSFASTVTTKVDLPPRALSTSPHLPASMPPRPPHHGAGHFQQAQCPNVQEMLCILI